MITRQSTHNEYLDVSILEHYLYNPLGGGKVAKEAKRIRPHLFLIVDQAGSDAFNDYYDWEM
jgi:hypothetical protein